MKTIKRCRKVHKFIRLAAMLALVITVEFLVPRTSFAQVETQVFFEETGHWVKDEFLTYFRTYGGLAIFGYPISEKLVDQGCIMYFEDGRIIQYFQRLKLQWQPNGATTTIVVGNLGEVYVNIYGHRILPEALRPVIDTRPETALSAAPAAINGLRAVVSLRYSVMNKKRNQTVSVLVTDNNGVPVPHAQVAISLIEMPADVTLPGSSQTLITDKQGFAQISLPVNEGGSGKQIVVRAVVSYGTWNATAKNVFLLWW